MKFVKLFILLLFLSANSWSKDELQAKFQDWSLFKTNRGDQIICYLASIPIKSNGNYIKRGEPYIIVTDIVNDADEVNVSSGIYYNENSDVELSFGLKKFYLFPFKSLAWSRDRNIDLNIIKEFQRQESVIISGVSNQGKIANDTYSLIGFSKAYEKMRKICK